MKHQPLMNSNTRPISQNHLMKTRSLQMKERIHNPHNPIHKHTLKTQTPTTEDPRVQSTLQIDYKFHMGENYTIHYPKNSL